MPGQERPVRLEPRRRVQHFSAREGRGPRHLAPQGQPPSSTRFPERASSCLSVLPWAGRCRLPRFLGHKTHIRPDVQTPAQSPCRANAPHGAPDGVPAAGATEVLSSCGEGCGSVAIIFLAVTAIICGAQRKAVGTLGRPLLEGSGPPLPCCLPLPEALGPGSRWPGSPPAAWSPWPSQRSGSPHGHTDLRLGPNLHPE